MRITCVLGSPNPNGISSSIAKNLISRVNNKDINIIELNKLSFKGCQACMNCKSNTEMCILEDDLTPILEEIKNTDILIIASGVYCYNITGNTQSFIERLSSFLDGAYETRLHSGKKAVAIIAQGVPDKSSSNDIIPRFNTMFDRLGFKEKYSIRSCGIQVESELLNHSETLDNIDKIAKELFVVA